MFFDNAELLTTVDHRHRELLAEAEAHRLGKLARAARRVTRRAGAAPPVPVPDPPARGGPAAAPSPVRELAGHRR